jgi:hypothetical protein
VRLFKSFRAKTRKASSGSFQLSEKCRNFDLSTILAATSVGRLSTIVAFMVTKRIWAKLVNEHRSYDVPIDLQARELRGTKLVPDDYVVERFRLADVCSLILEDGAYTLVYRFNNKQQQIPVCVLDGMLLAGVPA